MTTATVELVEPQKIKANRDNPRLIFRQDELDELRESIMEQGILVPLSVYREGKTYTLLDGERRWRCSLVLGLHAVPVIVQGKPDPVTNIMMMFAIHKARRDWDPLPTALKLEQLEAMLVDHNGKAPTEAKLAAAASLSRGEVRRYRKILALPKRFRNQLMKELEKPRPEQTITVDHVIEAMDGARRLNRAGVLDDKEDAALVQTVVDKFKAKVLTSTVEPRHLTKIATAVSNGQVTKVRVRRQLEKFRNDPSYTLNDVYHNTVEEVAAAQGAEQAVKRAIGRLQELRRRRTDVTPALRELLVEALEEIRALLRQA